MRRFWIIGAAVVVFAAAVVGLAAIMRNVDPRPPSRSISGSVAVRDNAEEYKTGKKCVGFGDLRSNASVSVTDETGKVIGRSVLSDGLGGSDPQTCIFAFVVDDLPSAGTYSVKVADRPGITHSKAELEANNWSVTLDAAQDQRRAGDRG
jgi:hypothetical protein